MVRIGVGVLGDSPILEFLSQVRLVERLGFDELWVADQRFLRDVYPLMSVAAQASESLRIGSAVADPFSRHPAITAASIATVDEISRGRAMLGIGVGKAGFPAMGLSAHRPVEAVRGAVDLIRHLLAGETADFESPTFRFRGSLDFRPRADIPIVVAARGPQMLQLAGEIGDQVMIGSFSSERTLQYALSNIAIGAERGGRDPASIPKLIWTYLAIDEDRASARDRVKPGVAAAVWTSRAAFRELGMAIPAELSSILDREGYNLSDTSVVSRVQKLVPDEFVDDMALAGTIEDVAAAMARVFGLGIEGIILWPFPKAGQSPETELTLLAHRVMTELGKSYEGA